MPQQAQQRLVDRPAFSEKFSGKFCFQVQTGQYLFQHGDGFLRHFNQLGSRKSFDAELQRAVAHVARVAEAVADEVQQVAAEVVAEVAGGIVDACRYQPQAFVVGIGFDFSLELLKMLLEKG